MSAELPSAIPLHMWPPKEINLEDSSISGKGFEFVEVRIIKNPISDKSVKKPTAQKIKLPAPRIIEKAVGRPSHKNDLILALEWMIKNKRVDINKSLKAHMDELNIALAQINPNSKYIGNLNYKTINRHLGERFNKYRKSQNQSQN